MKLFSVPVFTGIAAVLAGEQCWNKCNGKNYISGSATNEDGSDFTDKFDDIHAAKKQCYSMGDRCTGITGYKGQYTLHSGTSCRGTGWWQTSYLKIACPTDGDCYQDSRTRILPVGFGKSFPDNSAENCIAACEGHKYAGMQSGTQCFCGNYVPPESTKIDQSKCNEACPGNDSQKCGGYWTLNIYKVPKKEPVPVVPLPDISLPDISIPELPKPEDPAPEETVSFQPVVEFDPIPLLRDYTARFVAEVKSTFGEDSSYGKNQNKRPIEALSKRMEKIYGKKKCSTPKSAKLNTVPNTGNGCTDLAKILSDHESWISDHIEGCGHKKSAKQAAGFNDQIDKIQKRLGQKRCQKKLA